MGHPGRPGRLHGAPPGRAHLRAGVRPRAGAGASRAPSGSTPTPGSTCSAQAVAEAAGMPFADYLREAVCAPLGLAATTAGRLPRGRRRLHRRRPGPVRRRAAGAHAGAPEHPRRGRRRSPSPAWTACCPATAGSGPTTGGWASRSATASRRTGPARTARRARSGTSASPARSCGSTRTPGRPRVALTDRDFGEWAQQAWPPLTDGVLAGPVARRVEAPRTSAAGRVVVLAVRAGRLCPRVSPVKSLHGHTARLEPWRATRREATSARFGPHSPSGNYPRRGVVHWCPSRATRVPGSHPNAALRVRHAPRGDRRPARTP